MTKQIHRSKQKPRGQTGSHVTEPGSVRERYGTSSNTAYIRHKQYKYVKYIEMQHYIIKHGTYCII